MSAILPAESFHSTPRAPRAQFMANLILAQEQELAMMPRQLIATPRTTFKLLSYVEPVHPETLNDRLFERFSADPALHILPVVKNGKPLGLINRYQFTDRFAHPFRREAHDNKPCKELILSEPLLVEKNMPIEELSHFLAEVDSRHFADGFIITEQGRYIGVASGQDLLRELTRMQSEAARYADPLTLLPGNVPINEHIERLLQANTPFIACCCDLDHFKSFNDTYGYRKGDELIQLTGRVLSWACDPKLDFIGHIGGDDFILLMQSRDWKSRCENALRSFKQASSLMYQAEHLGAGGYTSAGRDGIVKLHQLVSLSIGATRVAPGHYLSHHEVSTAMTEAKEMAKKISGNSLSIEQRKTITKPERKAQ